jgi:hypothetical protein
MIINRSVKFSLKKEDKRKCVVVVEDRCLYFVPNLPRDEESE